MTFTYSSSETTDRNRVRGKTGDTDTATSRQLLQDETIDAILVLYPTVLAASIECIKRIIARLARDYDRSAVGMSVTRSPAIQTYKDLLIDLEREASSGAQMFVGGVSKSNNDILAADTNYVKASFKIGRDDLV